MTLTYVTVTGSFDDGSGSPLEGLVTFTPNQAVYASGVPLVTPDVPVQAQITGGQLQGLNGSPVRLLATDNDGLTFLSLTGFFYWTVSVALNNQEPQEWSFGLPSSPDSVDLYSLANTAYSGGGGGAVTSVFGRTGAVTANSGDYTVSQVTGAAPLASPALTGSPTAPPATALTSSTQVATTAYADSAVGVETSRAETAEALKAPLASPALTGSPTAPAQTTGGNSATNAPAAFATTAVEQERSRAETAEAFKAPLASPALTATPTAPTATGGTNTTQVA